MDTIVLIDRIKEYRGLDIPYVLPPPVINEIIGRLKVLSLVEFVTKESEEAWHKLGQKE